MIQFYIKTLKAQIAIDIYAVIVLLLTTYLFLRTGSGDYSKMLFYLSLLGIALLLCNFILQIITVTVALLSKNWKFSFRIFFHLFLILFLFYITVNVFKIVSTGGSAL